MAIKSHEDAKRAQREATGRLDSVRDGKREAENRDYQRDTSRETADKAAREWRKGN